MRIEVMSKSVIERYSGKCNEDAAIVVSIYSHNMDKAAIIESETNKIVDIIFLEFNDTDSRDDKFSMQSEQAKQLKEFIRVHLGDDNFDKIIVQCEAGQSRSAGVAAAIMKYFNNDDTPIFNNPRYTPNMLCYRKTLEELMNQ